MSGNKTWSFTPDPRKVMANSIVDILLTLFSSADSKSIATAILWVTCPHRNLQCISPVLDFTSYMYFPSSKTRSEAFSLNVLSSGFLRSNVSLPFFTIHPTNLMKPRCAVQ